MTRGEFKRFRKKSGLSQEKFAEKIGVSAGLVYAIEAGATITQRTLDKINDAFDTSLQTTDVVKDAYVMNYAEKNGQWVESDPVAKEIKKRIKEIRIEFPNGTIIHVDGSLSEVLKSVRGL